MDRDADHPQVCIPKHRRAHLRVSRSGVPRSAQITFNILAVLALALGIGAVTTIDSGIENVLLDPFHTTAAIASSQSVFTISAAERKTAAAVFRSPRSSPTSNRSTFLRDDHRRSGGMFCTPTIKVGFLVRREKEIAIQWSLGA